MKIPEKIELLLNELSKGFKRILKDNFVGFYVHGSLVMNCFNPERSDIDFLVVVKDKIHNKTKHEIIDFLIEMSGEATAQGFEMSVIKQSELDNFKYPTPFELHFSKDHIERHKADPSYFCGDDVDSDLAAHFVITKKRGICILGKPINDVFPEIPKEYYLDSIIKDSQWSLNNISKGPDTGECDVPLYAVLNFCRVLAYMKEGLITSKCEGGQWGIKNLPLKYKPLIQQALNKYLSRRIEPVQCALLKELARYVRPIFDNAKITK